MRITTMTRGFWTKPGLSAAVMLTAAAMFGGAAAAEDVKGCKEHDGFKRFEGSRIVKCDYRKFDEYAVPLGKLVDNEDFTKKNFKDKRLIEGKVDKNVYIVPGGASTAEVARNYETMFGDLGYTLLWQARTDEDLGGSFDYQHAQSFKGLQVLMMLNSETWRFDVYVKDEGSAKRYATVFAVAGRPDTYHYADSTSVQVVEGDTLVRVDTILVGSLEKKMQVVKSSDMKKAMDEFGRISLYGINFDFNKSDIKPDSRPVLDEIGKFLKDYPEEKLQIVGHTDNVGGDEFNQKLSEARANAVVADLVATYKVEGARLTAKGAGLTAPVAPNDTDDGRAKNRRVELVKAK
jgi:OmpA-OmpF porin, OOP family